MQTHNEWMEQISQQPEKCSRCRKKIQPNMLYWRFSKSPDAGDEYGADYCTICKDAVETKGSRHD